MKSVQTRWLYCRTNARTANVDEEDAIDASSTVMALGNVSPVNENSDTIEHAISLDPPHT